jgi:hypothetical protein
MRPLAAIGRLTGLERPPTAAAGRIHHYIGRAAAPDPSGGWREVGTAEGNHLGVGVHHDPGQRWPHRPLTVAAVGVHSQLDLRRGTSGPAVVPPGYGLEGLLPAQPWPAGRRGDPLAHVRELMDVDEAVLGSPLGGRRWRLGGWLAAADGHDGDQRRQQPSSPTVHTSRPPFEAVELGSVCAAEPAASSLWWAWRCWFWPPPARRQHNGCPPRWSEAGTGLAYGAAPGNPAPTRGPAGCLLDGLPPGRRPPQGRSASSASLRDRLRRPLTRPSSRRPGDTGRPGRARRSARPAGRRRGPWRTRKGPHPRWHLLTHQPRKEEQSPTGPPPRPSS